MKKKIIIGIMMVVGTICLFCGCNKVSKNSNIPVATTQKVFVASDSKMKTAGKTTNLITTTKTTTTTAITTITTTTSEYLVYNADTKRVHRNNCIYADTTMEKLVDNYVEEGRICPTCNPQVEIGILYEEPIINSIEIDDSSNVETMEISYPAGSCLTPEKGRHYGPSGEETYYNLDMSGCISIMRSMGYSESEYPVWTDARNVKYFGNYIMIAADLNTRPKGTLVETSLGTGIVVDTGGFAYSNPTQIDIATQW